MITSNRRLRLATLGAAIWAAGTIISPSAQAQNANCIDVLAGDPQFLRAMNGILAISMESTIRNAPSITIFAPTNDAVNSVSSIALQRYFPTQRGGQEAPDPVQGPAAINAHIVQGRHTAASIGQGANFTSQAGTPLNVARAGTAYNITGAPGTNATIVRADIPCSNGVIHAISRPLLTP